MSENQEVVRLCFKGGPYRESVLDTPALEAIVEFQAIVSDLAESLWKRRYVGPKKLPKGFRKSTRLVFRRIEAGSAIVPLEIVGGAEQQYLPILANTDEVTEAIRITYNTFLAANSNEQLPDNVPKSMLGQFSQLGNSLPEDVEMQVAPPRMEMTSVSPTARERLKFLSANNYQDSVEISGKVFEADVRKKCFQILADDETKVVVQFTEELEDQVTTALKEHTSMQLRVNGKAEFSSDGQLRKVLKVEHLELLSNEAHFDTSAPSIQDVILDLFSDVPDSEWDRLPSDGSHRHDFYLYGINKQ